MNRQFSLRQAESLAALLLIFALADSTAAYAQGKPGGGGGNAAANQAANTSSNPSSPSGQGGPSTSSPGGGSSALQGLSYSRASWPQIHAMPAPSAFLLKNDDIGHFFFDDLWGHSFRKDVVIFCYDLKTNLSATQPFVLEPTPIAEDDTDANDPTKPYSRELCTNQVHSVHKAVSLLMGRYLVFRIDMKGIPAEIFERIQTLNINVTNQAGTSFNTQRGPSLNPATTRPSSALISGMEFPCATLIYDQLTEYKVAGLPLRYAFCPDDAYDRTDHVYYLVWPGPLLGDTIASVSVNLIYTPVGAALPWKPQTFYPAGAIINADNHTGHYYVAVNGGISSEDPPNFRHAITKAKIVFREIGSSGLSWRDGGEIAPTAPTPAAWSASHSYAKDKWVSVKDECYQAKHSGTSGTNVHVFDGVTYPGHEVDDGGVSWIPRGSCSVSATPQPWAATTAYATDAVVVPPNLKSKDGNPPPGTHYYIAKDKGGVSGSTPPPFEVHGADTVESTGIQYMDTGTTPPATGLREWEAETLFRIGDVILDQKNGHYYSVVQGGISSQEHPHFSITDPKIASDDTTDGIVQWQDLGATLPTGTVVGSQPADQVLNVLNLSLPQIQVLSRFNLASGVILSSLRPPAVSSYTANSSTGCPSGVNNCTVYTASKGGHLIDPVLGVTVYAFKPLDAERGFRPADLVPEPTFDISLSAPTTNFHFGLASEFFVRNLQIVYGASIIQDTRLAGTITYEPGGGSTPTPGTQPTAFFTTKKQNIGVFVGFTFNITGFIQSLIP